MGRFIIRCLVAVVIPLGVAHALATHPDGASFSRGTAGAGAAATGDDRVVNLRRAMEALRAIDRARL